LTVAYRDRNDILDPSYAKRVNAGGGVLSPVIVIRGKVVGTWKRTITNGKLVLTPTFFKKLDRADRRLLELATARYSRFLGIVVGSS
jgi:hypothetical protein